MFYSGHNTCMNKTHKQLSVMMGMLAEARCKLVFFLDKAKNKRLSAGDLIHIEQIHKDIAKYRKQHRLLEKQI